MGQLTRTAGGFPIPRKGGRPRDPAAIRRDFTRGLRFLGRAIAHLTAREAARLLEHEGELLTMGKDAGEAIRMLRPLAQCSTTSPRCPRVLAALCDEYETALAYCANSLDPELLTEVKAWLW